MTSYVETLLVKHVKLSSIDEAKLTQGQVSLDDSLSLLQSLSKEFDNESANAKFAECVGVMAILTTVVSDIVRDNSKEARMELSNAIRSLQKNIKALKEQRQQVQFYLDTGTGAAPQQMFTPQQSPGRLP